LERFYKIPASLGASFRKQGRPRWRPTLAFIYQMCCKQTLENMATSGSANTEVDFVFVKPGASRTVSAQKVSVQGKGAQLTALSGISVRLKQWTSTASTTVAGTGTTPQPKNNLVPACVATSGQATSAASNITSGTGGPQQVGYQGMGGSGPGGNAPINPDDSPLLDGNATKSMDLFSSCPTASLSFEWALDISEAGSA
jgi:hypothetical protein